MPSAYQPQDIERQWYERWEKEDLFGASPASGREPFTIVIPPPNVTGALHMGHAFEHTLQDALIRRARMQGYEALWLPGTDHAGIATQNVVERELAREGKSRHDLGREAFVERVWQWKRQYGSRITEQMRRLGDSCDWSRERFTMDEGLSRAVRTVFVRWFDDGLIYRGTRIINWCPRCTTALSDIEVNHEEVDGELVTFRYELADGSGSIPVATTRLETMLGDTGVAVYPGDGRYKALVGRQIRHPFFPERDIPIVADEAVDPEFGTGAVKVTPAHDPNDFEIGQRHGLAQVNILDEQAHVNDNGGPFAGLDRYEARKAVFEELSRRGLIEGVQRPYPHAVGHCDRCGTEIEPWLSEQWFVKMKPLARPAIAAVREGRIRIHPKRFEKSYLDWMENIRDWTISRQLWWGHRIPVWYCDDCGHHFAALEDPTDCEKCKGSSLRQDPDVLDTWFSSQLWPFSTLGWPDETEDLRYFYPTSVMAPGYEILYLWVARMIMSGLYFMGDVPFRDVMIHGIVRDFEGKKMSKSLGNVIDPLAVIDQYGADALRFSLAFGAVPGSDTNVSEDRIEGARNFANKLWNASRFVLMSLGDDRPALPGDADLDIADRWILSRLDRNIAAIDAAIEDFDFAEATHVIHGFIWGEYCDWYIEMAKLELNGPRSQVKQAVLVEVLDGILRLLHPVMPFITEELWNRLRRDGQSVMKASWPASRGREDDEAEAAVARFQDLVAGLRRLRSEHDLPVAQKMPITIAAHEYEEEVSALREPLKALARLDSVDFVASIESAAGTARVVTDAGIEAAVRLGDVVDLDVERRRLTRKLEELQGDIARAEKKLENERFLAKAPADVVDKERRKLDEARLTRERVEAQLKALA